LKEVVKLTVKGQSAKSYREEKKMAFADSLRGFIICPRHERVSAAHYLDVSTVARAANMFTAMAIWSKEELTKMREKAKGEHSSAVFAAIEKNESNLRMARGAETLEIIDACRTHGTAFIANAFQDQVKALWDREDGIYRRDAQRKADLIAAAAMSSPHQEKRVESMKQERTAIVEERGEETRALFMKRLEHRLTVNAKSTGIIGAGSHGRILPKEVKYDNEGEVLSINQREAIEVLARRHDYYEDITEKTIQFQKDDTLDQLADGLTKALKGPAFEVWRNRFLAGSKEDLIEHG